MKEALVHCPMYGHIHISVRVTGTKVRSSSAAPREGWPPTSRRAYEATIDAVRTPARDAVRSKAADHQLPVALIYPFIRMTG